MGDRRAVIAINEWGDVRTRTGDDSTLRVSAMIQRIGTLPEPFRIDVEEGTEAVTVRVVPQLAEPGGRVDLTLMIPAGKRLEVGTRDGLAEIKHDGEVVARSRAGRLYVRTPHGVRASSESGAIIARLSDPDWRQTASLSSGSGDITVAVPADVPGAGTLPKKIRSGSGRVQIVTRASGG